MAPKKPLKKPATKAAKSTKAPAKAASKPISAAAMAVQNRREAERRAAERRTAARRMSEMATAKAACTEGKGMLCCITSHCPIGKAVFSKEFPLAAMVTFLVVAGVDFVVNAKILMPEYAATSAIWRPQAEMHMEICLLAQVLTSMVYAAIILGLGHAYRWFGSFTSGVLAASPMAISSLMAYMSLPLATPYIPAMWAASALVGGGLAGLAICTSLRLTYGGKSGGCCGSASCDC